LGAEKFNGFCSSLRTINTNFVAAKPYFSFFGKFSQKAKHGIFVPIGTLSVYYVTNKSQCLKESHVNLRDISDHIKRGSK